MRPGVRQIMVHDIKDLGARAARSGMNMTRIVIGRDRMIRFRDRICAKE